MVTVIMGELGGAASPADTYSPWSAPRSCSSAVGVAAFHLAVVSAADPVDRATGRLVHLPGAPFLLGELSPPDVLEGMVDGPVIVDNDVNWPALSLIFTCALFAFGGGAVTLDDLADVVAGRGVNRPGSDGGAGGARTHDLTDYESAALTN